MARSLYSVFAAEGLRQGKSLEEIGRAWRKSHGGRRANPYTPEGTHREHRNERLREGLRLWPNDFGRALRYAETGENPGRAKREGRGLMEHAFRHAGEPHAAVDRSGRPYQQGGYRSRSGEGYFKQKHWENHRRQNPSIPGLDWLRDHWMEALVYTGVAYGGIYAIKKLAAKKDACCADCAAGHTCSGGTTMPHATTAADAVAVDQGQFGAEAARGGPGPMVLLSGSQPATCSTGRIARDGLCWHPRNGGVGWFAHNPRNISNPAGVGGSADSGLRFMSSGTPDF